MTDAPSYDAPVVDAPPAYEAPVEAPPAYDAPVVSQPPAQEFGSPAFGGDELCTLYVTTARQERPAEELAQLPQSGGLFSKPMPVPGLHEHLFAG